MQKRRLVAFAAGLLICPIALAQVELNNDVFDPYPVGVDVPGEKLDPSTFGEAILEDFDAVKQREREMAERGELFHLRESGPGAWTVPGERAVTEAHSGTKYLMNKWGDTRMGITFPVDVNVEGAFFAGQGSGPGAWAKSVRAIGYRDGQQVATSDWLEVGEKHQWLNMGFKDVDRIEIDAVVATNGGGWYAMDDLTYFDSAQSKQVVLDFEDLPFRVDLTDTNYAGLTWERGTGDYYRTDKVIHSPITLEEEFIEPPVPQVHDDSRSEGERGGTAPLLVDDFQSSNRGGGPWPPDTCGAIGPNHWVTIVNGYYRVHNKATGGTVQSTTLGAFLPGGSGDPRILFDQHSGRWIAIDSNFNNRIYLAVSATDNPTGAWFKTNILVSTGSDAGCFPDFPTLGVDVNGIYVTSYMVGCGMSVFAIDKAPLIASPQSLGTVTAFRGLPFSGALQPVHTYGTPTGEYMIEASGSPQLRIRRVNPPLNAPTLTTVGTVTVSGYSTPPDAPALGASTNLDTVDTRLGQSMLIGDSIWTAHCINISGRAGIRWYQVRYTPTLAVLQTGSISDPVRHYYFPGIAANALGDMAIGFTGSHANERPSAYYTGRISSDSPGQTASPVLYRAGSAVSYNLLDSFGRNRWGDYSATTVDPADQSFWTIQEYVQGTNDWGTHVAHLEFNPSAPSDFDLLTPAGGATGVSLSPFFQWESAAGALSYDLTVDDDSDFSSPIVSLSTVLTTHQVVGDPLTQATEYFWQVVATNSFGQTTGTPAVQTFQTTGPAPGSFVLASPPGGSTETTTEVNFIWTESNSASEYRLEVDNNGDFSSPEVDEAGIASVPGLNSFMVAPGVLQNNTTYNWRVTASNVIGDTPSTPASLQFMIQATPTGCDGDADGNNAVDVNDISFIVFRLGNSGAPCIDGDVDGNGSVNVNDISYTVFRLGTCDPPTNCP